MEEFAKFYVKGGPVDLGTKILQKYKKKKSSLYSKSLLIFINKTRVVENHPTRREIRELLWPNYGDHVGLRTLWLRVRYPVEATFLYGVFSPLTSV